MNIRYRDRDPEIPSGGFKPDHRRHRKEAKAGSHNGPHGLPRCTLVYCGRATLSLRRNGPTKRADETGRKGGIGGGPIPNNTTRCGALK